MIWVWAFFLSFVAQADCNVDVPLFESGGPVCSALRQEIDCGCTEFMDWDSVDFNDPTNQFEKWYDVYYRVVPSQTWILYGTTRWRPDPLEARFYYAWGGVSIVNPHFVQYGTLYEFSIKACKNVDGALICSEDFSNVIRYKGAPYFCYENGVQVPCGN